MNRRKTIKIISTFSAGILSLPILSGVLESCHTGFRSGRDKDFSNDEREMIGQLSNAIIPDTQTPGAVNAAVPAYIILMLGDCYDQPTREVFHQGLSEFNNRCLQKYQSSFLSLSKEKQEAFVRVFDREIMNNKGQEGLTSFYKLFKQLTIEGFFTSQTGATQTLRYLPVPGHYSGCIPYTKGDKEWAT